MKALLCDYCRKKGDYPKGISYTAEATTVPVEGTPARDFIVMVRAHPGQKHVDLCPPCFAAVLRIAAREAEEGR